MVKDITIENFRLFRKFSLSRLTQLNLLVGANNSGKSSLLEAIYLLISQNPPSALLEILELRTRGEVSSSLKFDLYQNYQVSNIFRGHVLTQNYPVNIYSSSELDTSLLIRFVENYKRGVLQKSFFDESSKKTIETASGLLLSYKSGTFTVNSFLVTENGFIESSIPSPSEQNNKFITTDYIDYTEIAELWDQITLTPKEEQLLDALRILEPEVERISFTSAPASNNRILLKLKGRNAPVPLSSMGDGMRRMLALAASLVSSEKGALLIDEIDTGLHYKALTNMWRLIIETAKKLDVQIFATTHSWDCLAAFQQALTQTKEDDLGTVFRLERKNGQIDHVSYTGKELAVAVAHDIEVR